MCNILRTFLAALGLVFCITPAQAFDDDFKINDINLNEENFLDIKAHRFRKSREYQWYDNTSAWRITGASLDGDLAFLQTEMKLQDELSEYLNVRLEIEQEVFYADKDFSSPKAEVEFYPWAGNLSFSLLGTPAYEKREMDLGFALKWGKRPWDYIRFEYLDVNALYNQKNVTDNTFYREDPRSLKLEGAYQFGGQYKLRFSIRREQQLVLIDPDTSGQFTHKGNDFFLLLDYLATPGSVIGVTFNGFSMDKSSLQPGEHLQQATDYFSADIYWVRGMGKAYEVRFGTQYDIISNDIRDLVSSLNNLDYFMETLQVYATAYHPFNEHMAWDLGFYIGQVEEQQDFLQDNSRDTLNESVEAKLRLGFEYASADDRNTLQFNISLNADDVFKDPGDGAGISFQSVF